MASAYLILCACSKTKRILGAIVTSYDAMNMTMMSSVRYATLQTVEAPTLDRALSDARYQLAHHIYDWIGPLNESGGRTTNTKPSDLLAREDEEDGSSSTGTDEVQGGGAR